MNLTQRLQTFRLNTAQVTHKPTTLNPTIKLAALNAAQKDKQTADQYLQTFRQGANSR